MIMIRRAVAIAGILGIFIAPAAFAAFEMHLTGFEDKPAAELTDQSFYDEIQNIYRLGLALVGVSALFVIVWGGLDYLTAGESASRVETGKKRIWNGLYGIALAAISFALLYTINPDLVKLRIGTPTPTGQQEPAK